METNTVNKKTEVEQMEQKIEEILEHKNFGLKVDVGTITSCIFGGNKKYFALHLCFLGYKGEVKSKVTTVLSDEELHIFISSLQVISNEIKNQGK
jgi:hypothetical protein